MGLFGNIFGKRGDAYDQFMEIQRMRDAELVNSNPLLFIGGGIAGQGLYPPPPSQPSAWRTRTLSALNQGMSAAQSQRSCRHPRTTAPCSA